MVTFKSYLAYRRTDNTFKVSRFRSICFFSQEATCWHIYGGLRYHHSGSERSKNQKLNPDEKPNRVGLFWDLDNKPPNAIPPFDVANKLRIAASSFGIVRYMVAYANSHTFSHVPRSVREKRKERELLYRLENKVSSSQMNLIVVGSVGESFIPMTSLSAISSKYSMKMKKYKKAASAILTPKVGCGLAYELKRAGFWVQTVLISRKLQFEHCKATLWMSWIIGGLNVWFLLVSDDSDFVDVIKEARLQCLNDGCRWGY